MRRDHLLLVPAFKRYYGISPWELRWYSPLEIDELITQLPDIIKATRGGGPSG